MQPSSEHDDSSPTLSTPVLWGFLGACFLWKLAFVAFGPMLEAEAYYWEWSKHLAWGYFDHPPMIAYVIWLFTKLGSDSALYIKLGALCLNLGSTLFYYLLAREMFEKRTALVATAILQVMPFFAAVGVLATPDAPLLFFWMLSTYLVYRALYGRGMGLWLAAGAALGMALMSKYHAVLLVPGVFIFLALSPRQRRWLASPAPYLAALVALLVFAPNVIWNLEHSLTTMRFLLVERHSSAPPLLLGVLKFFGGILLMLSPVFAVQFTGLSRTLFRRALSGADDRFLFLLATGLFPVLFFGVLSPLVQVGAHWTAVGFASLVLAVCGFVLEHPSATNPFGTRCCLAWSVGTSAFLMLIASGLPLAASILPTTVQVRGQTIDTGLSHLTREILDWDAFATNIEDRVASMPHPARTFIITDQYRLASMARLFTHSTIPTRITGYRASHQYRLWSDEQNLTGWDAIFFDKTQRKHHARVLDALFERVGPVEVFAVEDASGSLRSFYLYRCYGYRGVFAEPQELSDEQADEPPEE